VLKQRGYRDLAFLRPKLWQMGIPGFAVDQIFLFSCKICRRRGRWARGGGRCCCVKPGKFLLGWLAESLRCLCGAWHGHALTSSTLTCHLAFPLDMTRRIL